MDNAEQNAQNVITMSDFQPDTGYGAMAQVEAYWEALRGGRLMPKRSEIDPRGIERALENAFILERIAAGVARMRIAGSHLNALMGMEVRGMPLTAFFVPDARRRIADALEEVFQTPATCQVRMTSTGPAGDTAPDARMVMLPLKSDLGDVSRVLGCFVSPGEIGQAPRRFDIRTLDLRRIVPTGGAAPLPPLPADARTGPVAAGFADPRHPFAANPGKARPPYLRLVKSDDRDD